jgi:hypothetical protein
MELVIEENDIFEHTEESKRGWYDHFANRPWSPIDQAPERAQYTSGRLWAEGYEREQDLKPARPILDRMREAYENGLGVEISAEELQILATTDMADVWEKPDPRLETIVPDGSTDH